MEIQLSEAREQFVRSLLEGGHYSTENEVIEAALQSFEESGEQANLADLRREIAVGIDEADRGELALFDPAATLARVRSRHESRP